MARLRGYGRAAADRVRQADRPLRHRGVPRQARQEAVGRPAPPGRPGRQPRDPARAGGARRADHRPRPAEPPGGLGQPCASSSPRGLPCYSPRSTWRRPTSWPTRSCSSTTAGGGAGTPAELRAQIGDQRVDVVATDPSGFERLVPRSAGFELTLAPERRTVSVPAPREARRPGRRSPTVVVRPACPSTRWRCAARHSTTPSWLSPVGPPDPTTNHVEVRA